MLNGIDDSKDKKFLDRATFWSVTLCVVVMVSYLTHYFYTIFFVN